MAKNADSALKLGQARGVAIVAAVNQELPVFEYAARQVKQTVVGIGSAEKSQVQHMVRTLLKLPANPQADAADALAIAITHCHVSQNAMQMSESRLNLARGRLRLVIPPRSVQAEAFQLPPRESTPNPDDATNWLA